MEKDVAATLTKWGLKEFIPKFIENQISIELFPKLSDDDLKELIPPIGPRILFKTNCNKTTSEGASTSCQEQTRGKKRKFTESTETSKQKKVDIFDPDYLLKSVPTVTEVLKETSIGETILTNYKIQKVLTETQRTHIVDVLVQKLRKVMPKANNIIFKKLAENLCEVFSTETIKTYYLSPQSKKNSKSGKSERSRGKIPVKWRNVQNLTKVFDQITVETVKPTEKDSVEPAHEELETSLKWLEENECFDIDDDVLDHWTKTADYRTKFIKESQSDFSKIINKWKILQQPEAYKLIELAFSHSKFSSTEVTEERWRKFITSVETICKRSYDNENIKGLKAYLQSDLNSDCRIRSEISLLCHLLPSKVTIKRKKAKGEKGSTWKVSIADCCNSIIQHVALPSGIEDKKKERLELLHDYGRTVQPYILVTGPTLKELDGFYTSINEILYKLPSLWEAFTLCFKSFHVFCTEYPKESEHIWLLIQKALFRFDTKWDSVLPHVETVFHAMQQGTGVDVQDHLGSEQIENQKQHEEKDKNKKNSGSNNADGESEDDDSPDSEPEELENVKSGKTKKNGNASSDGNFDDDSEETSGKEE